MNLLLFERDEIATAETIAKDQAPEVILEGRRAAHLRAVLKVEVGRKLRAGVIGGARGRATVLALDPLTLRFEPTEGPSPQPRVDLLLALPRPKGLRRLLGAMGTLGVGALTLLNAWRVEKSYFSSPLLEAEPIRAALIVGMEQGRTTWLPEVAVRRRFVEALTELPAVDEDPRRRVLLEPGSDAGLEALHPLSPAEGRVLVAVGPEGGWTERELASFAEAGFTALSLGDAVVRSETAVTAALAQLALLARLSKAAEYCDPENK